jgi:hypothetical protein
MLPNVPYVSYVQYLQLMCDSFFDFMNTYKYVFSKF